jgi:hypothetical protein
MNWRSRRICLDLATVAALFNAASTAAEAQLKKPNIVIIWGDDIVATNTCPRSMVLTSSTATSIT